LVKIEKEQWKIIIPTLLGIIFLLLSIIADPAFKISTINAATNPDNTTIVGSDTNFADAYTLDVPIAEGQRIHVRFSVNKANMTVTLMILSKAEYITILNANVTAPNAVGAGPRLPFVTYNPDLTDTTPNGNNVDMTTLTYSGSVQFEFGGSATGDVVLNVPGDYVILVYGTNDWANDPDNIIPFSLEVTTEGPWKTFEVLFAVLAFIALAIAGLLALMEYRPSLFGGVEE
jgi:hypothetical protein